MNTTITGTKWLNAAQLQTVQQSIADSHIHSINCGVYSNGDVVAVCNMIDGNTHSIHLTEAGQIVPPYQHLQ